MLSDIVLPERLISVLSGGSIVAVSGRMARSPHRAETREREFQVFCSSLLKRQSMPDQAVLAEIEPIVHR
jgi:hypothetical protein